MNKAYVQETRNTRGKDVGHGNETRHQVHYPLIAQGVGTDRHTLHHMQVSSRGNS